LGGTLVVCEDAVDALAMRTEISQKFPALSINTGADAQDDMVIVEESSLLDLLQRTNTCWWRLVLMHNAITPPLVASCATVKAVSRWVVTNKVGRANICLLLSAIGRRLPQEEVDAFDAGGAATNSILTAILDHGVILKHV
jgi:hypothetical protein